VETRWIFYMNYERLYIVDLNESIGTVEMRPYLIEVDTWHSCYSLVETEIDCASTGSNLLSIEL
jgi:hypothetical protein